jgi:endonuclease/exonuclease/phosphatase family metal-dependent hydrolase
MPRHVPEPGPRPERLALLLAPIVVVAVVAIVLLLWSGGPTRPAPGRPRVGRDLPVPSPGDYLYCTWNVENLFDDQDDPNSHDEDDDWFSAHPELLREKLDHLAEALLRLDGGRGPDILAIVEVENRRAVELLRDALNARLPTELRYEGLVHRDNRTGRRIEPAILTRLQVLDPSPGPPLAGRVPRTVQPRPEADPHNFGIRRILEARVAAEGVPLSILVSHWTSRVTDETDAKRSDYADALYAATLDLIHRNPDADVILSGDFNDEPTDPSLADHLRITADPAESRAADARPRLLDLMAGRDPGRFGTYYYNKRWQIFDHVIVSPGLLDRAGWEVVPDSLAVVNDSFLRSGRGGGPFRFGGPGTKGARGYSDHFAVTVRLRVSRPETTH